MLNKILRTLFCLAIILLGYGTISSNLFATEYPGSCKCSAKFTKSFCSKGKNSEFGCEEWGQATPVPGWTPFDSPATDIQACVDMGKKTIPATVIVADCQAPSDCYQFAYLESCCCTSTEPSSCKDANGQLCNPQGQ